MIKIGIIGSGFGLYGLLPAFNSLNNCKVVCFCGKKTERSLNYCSSIGLKNIYTDWELMLERENLDAVAIAVVPNAQYKIAKVAIKKGLHVFAEKPLAANLKQAKELAAFAKKRKIVTAVDFIFPEIGQWQKVKELLDKKTYGDLKQISVNWDFLSYDIKHKISSWKTNSGQGGGALSFYFSHVLYYLENFAGQIIDVKSQLSYSKQSRGGGEVGVDALLKFKSGAVGNARLCCSANGLNRHNLLFICDRACIVLGNQGSATDNFKLEIHREGKITKLLLNKEKTFNNGVDARVSYVKKIAGRFVKACLRGGSLKPSFKDGLRVQEIIVKTRVASN